MSPIIKKKIFFPFSYYDEYFRYGVRICRSNLHGVSRLRKEEEVEIEMSFIGF